MKKAGLIGGIGPESTIIYYHDIAYGVQEKTDKHFFPSLSIESLNVFDIFKFCQKEEYDKLAGYILQAIKNLAVSGANFAALTGNTPHIIFDQLQAQSPIPLISIVNETYKKAQQKKLSRVLLLGTSFTMREDFFKKLFTNGGIEIITPSEAEMDYIDDKISKELEIGIVNPETQSTFIEIIKKIQKDKDVQSVILGCTELPLILNEKVLSLPCLDTMKIHIQSIIKEILA